MSARRAAIAVVVLTGAFASPAAAERTPLGIANANEGIDGYGCAPCTLAQTSSPEGSFTAPADGRIVEWWVGGLPSSTAKLRVLRRVLPLTQVRYRAVESSSVETIDKAVTHHSTDLPVLANDLIGVTVLTGILGREFGGGELNDVFSDAFPDGTAETPSGADNMAYAEYGAEFVFRPAVTSLDTTSGPATGGGTLTINGAHLTESTQVLFGSTPATSMSVVSNTRITVRIPPGSGTADVTVIGPGGTSVPTGADQYTYLARSATVNPSVLDFGHALVGKTSDVKSVTLTNDGKIAVSIGAVTLTGTDAGDFTTLSDGCAAHDVPAGGSCAVKLVFTPSAAGTRHATLRLGDNSSDGPHAVVLTGSGDSPSPVGTTTTTSTTPSAPPAPSRVFTIGRLRGRTLRVAVRSRGVVRVASRFLLVSRAAGGPGVIVVKLRLTAAARTSLARHHRLALRARITFTPHGGRPATKVHSLLLKSP